MLQRWTQQEKDYLINHYKMQTTEEIAKALNRTFIAVEAQRHKLRLIKYPRWSKLEIKYLIKHWDEGCSAIAKVLHRNPKLIFKKGVSLNLPPKNHKWTDEDDEFLKEHYYSKTNKWIAKKIGCLEGAVEGRAKLLKMGGKTSDGRMYLGTVIRLLTGNIANHTSYRQFKALDIPYKKLPSQANKKTYNYIVDLEKFWKWLEKHQEKFDFANFQADSMGVEPEWVIAKRRKDCMVHNRNRWAEYYK